MLNKIKKMVTGSVLAIVAVFAMAVGSVGATPVDNSVDFTGVVLPFTVQDMLVTATNFLAMYGVWIALVLGVLFAPVFYSLAMKLISGVRAKMKA